MLSFPISTHRVLGFRPEYTSVFLSLNCTHWHNSASFHELHTQQIGTHVSFSQLQKSTRYCALWKCSRLLPCKYKEWKCPCQLLVLFENLSFLTLSGVGISDISGVAKGGGRWGRSPPLRFERRKMKIKKKLSMCDIKPMPLFFFFNNSC